MPLDQASTTQALSRALWTARVVVLLIAVVMLTLLGRVMQLQLRPPQGIVAMRNSQQSKTTLTARRGNILDRRGRIIAGTRMVSRLYADAKIIDDLDYFSSTVGAALGYDPITIRDTVAHRYKSRYIVLDDALDPQQEILLSNLNLRGLGSDLRAVREYPQGTLAGQLIGFVGTENKGLEGIERMFEPMLSATPGEMRYLRDARRRTLWIDSEDYRLPREGQSINLSIDMVIQDIAQRQLRTTCEEYGAEAGQIIVLQPHTGEILAMANYPEFDPNSRGNTNAALRRNRAVTDTFEPGSIFKPFVWAVATQLRLADPKEIIDTTDEGVWVSQRGRRLRDSHPNGKISWEGVLMKSSNIGMAIVAQRMTSEQINQAVRTFGFGQSTGSDLPGEVAGMITPMSKWTHYSDTSVPMGQEVAVTGLQMARAYGAIANGGALVRPTIVAQDPLSPLSLAPVHEQVLTRDVARLTREVLRRTVSEGTGQKAKSKMYPILGKTGTAQVPGKGGYAPDQYVASFCAAAPADAPQLVVVCFIHKPDHKKGYYGGIVAAPPVRNVIEQSLVYLGIEPDHIADTGSPAYIVRVND